MVDNRLCLLVAGAFNACNADFLTKVEAHIKLGTDSQQVVGKHLKIFIFICVQSLQIIWVKLSNFNVN